MRVAQTAGKGWSYGAWLAVVFLPLAVAALVLKIVPPGLYYDAALYELAAESIRRSGLFQPWPGVDLRTYGYPVVLALASSLGGLVGWGTRDSAFAVQWVVLVASAAFLARSPLPAGCGATTWRRQLVFLAVAANPLVVARCAEVLTESLSIACVLVAAGALLRLPTGSPTGRHSAPAALWVAVAGLCSGFAMMLRPASIVIPISFALAILGWTVHARRSCSVPGRAIVLPAGLAVTSVLLPLAPQMLLNARLFQRWTPFPTVDIAEIQAQGGAVMFRYATNVTGCGEPAMAFSNPWLASVPDTFGTWDAIRYYATDLPHGPLTVLAHLFSGLDPKPFSTYVTRLDAPYETVLQVVSIGVLVLAAPSLWAAAARWRFLVTQPGAVFLATTGAGALGVLGYSAAEYRFGLIPMTLLSLLAARTLSGPRLSRRAVATTLSCALVLTPAWFLLSGAVLAQSPVWRACT